MFRKPRMHPLLSKQTSRRARGLTNYPAAEIAKIKGLKTDAIAAALDHRPYDEVIHRDNMTVTG